MDSRSFTFIAASDKSVVYERTNTPTRYTNKFIKPIEHPEIYRVGLGELFYGDNWEKRVPTLGQTTPNPIPTTTTGKPWMTWGEMEKKKFKVFLPTYANAVATKQANTGFATFVTAFSFNANALPTLTLETYIDHTGAYAELTFTPPEDGNEYYVELDTNAASVLGFKNRRFTKGSHRSESKLSQAAYDKIADGEVFTIYTYSYKVQEIELERYEDFEESELEDLLLEIVLKLRGNNIRAALILDPLDGRFVDVVIDTPHVRLQFFPELNRILGVPTDYVLSKDKERLLLPTMKTLSTTADVIYVMCSIVEESQVGEVEKTLLRMFPRQSGLSRAHHIEFSNIQYVPLKPRAHSEVTIELLDGEFNPLPQSSIGTTAALLFKSVF